MSFNTACIQPPRSIQDLDMWIFWKDYSILLHWLFFIYSVQPYKVSRWCPFSFSFLFCKIRLIDNLEAFAGGLNGEICGPISKWLVVNRCSTNHSLPLLHVLSLLLISAAQSHDTVLITADGWLCTAPSCHAPSAHRMQSSAPFRSLVSE